jgi:hypothetical protein
MRLPGFLRRLLRKNPPEPLPPGIIRLPLATKQKPDFLVFEIGFSIEVRGERRKFFPLPFLLDTCADYTQLPCSVADRLGIPYTTDREVTINTVIGRGDLHFSFRALPEWQCETTACLAP